MFRLKAIIAAVVCVFSATTASAAVATYSGETYAWFQLDSAYLAGTKVDASHLLNFWGADADYYLDREGRTTFDGDGDPYPWSYTRWQTTGAASNHSSFATVYADEWFGHTYFNDSDSVIDVTFSYAIEAHATAHRTGKAEAWADVSAEIFFGSSIFDWSNGYSVQASTKTDSRKASAQAMSGTVSFTLAPEEMIAPVAYYQILGGAEVAPVPVAGALPFLGTALAAFGFAARRRARLRR